MARMLGHFPLPESAIEPHQGVATWVNPHNKCAVLLVHYTAEEERRSLTWQTQAKEGYATESAWDQEQELDFSSWQGVPVFGSFSAAYHVAKEPLMWSKRTDWPMIRGWDFGTQACVWAQLQRTLQGERLMLFTSRQTAGAFPATERKYERFEIEVTGLSLFIRECVALSDYWYPGIVEWTDIIDSSGFNRTSLKGLPASTIFQSLGLVPIPGRTQDTTVRVSAVEDWLSLFTKYGPAFQIDPQALVVIDGFSGGYHWTQLAGKKKPDKGPWSHVMDCFEYICTVFPSPKTIELRHMEQRRQQQQRLDQGRSPFESSRHRQEQSGKIDW